MHYENILRLDVTNVHLKFNKMRYIQPEGFVLSVSFPMILKKLKIWPKSFEKSCRKHGEERRARLLT